MSSDEVLGSQDICVLGRASFLQLLQHEDLAASSEALVFRAVVAWGREHVRTRGEEEEPKSQPHHPVQEDPLPQASAAVGGAAAATAELDESPRSSLNQKVKQFLPQIKMSYERAMLSSPGQATDEVCASRSQDTPCMKNSVKEESLPRRQKPWAPGEEPSDKTLRNVVDEFLLHVRFLNMTTDEFVEHVMSCGILTSEESVSLLLNIKNIDDVPLPWFAMSSARDARKNRQKSADLMFCQDHYIVNEQEILREFKVSMSVYMSQMTAPGVTSVKDSVVKILSSSRETVGMGRWRGIGCKFDHPVKLSAGETYSVVVEQAYGSCAGCQCQVSSEHDGIHFSGKTLGLTPVFIEYWEAA